MPRAGPGRPMSRRSWLALLLLLCCTWAVAFSDSEDEYSRCILQYQKQAKENQAAMLIAQACNKLHNEGGFLFDREKAYYQCLLDNLPGVRNSIAVQKIRSACNQLYLE